VNLRSVQGRACEPLEDRALAKKKQRLVFYSGGQEKRNWLLHEELVTLARKKKRVHMTFIPFCSEGHNVFYQRFIRRYKPYGATHFDCIPVDDPSLKLQRDTKERILNSDIIYLSGGNTYYFLKHLRSSGIDKLLQSHVAKGGVLGGLSAGSIIMTPHIGLAGYPAFDRDENEVGIKKLHSLNLVNFEFFPHYRNSKRYREAMLSYSKKSKYPIYACKDGSGLVVHDDRFTVYGEVFLFLNGQIQPLAT
jgi:dipeptidase E